MDLSTLDFQVQDGVGRVTLNRPERHNAFDDAMQEELSGLWRYLRDEDEVRAVVLSGSGERAFCTGIDRTDREFAYDPMTYEDPGKQIGPKSQGLWKPVVAAVNGMACGGAFYLLGEADVIIAAEHATFFDPHVTYGMTAVFEPILLLPRMPFGEVVRIALAGAHERMSAKRAMLAGLVSEVVPGPELPGAAHRLAAIFAAQPAEAVQATLRTLWAARELSPRHATDLGNAFLSMGWSDEALAEGQQLFTSGPRIEPRIR